MMLKTKEKLIKILSNVPIYNKNFNLEKLHQIHFHPVALPTTIKC